MVLAVLEDNPARVAATRRCLEALPGVESVFFLHAGEMIEWLGDHILEVDLISLDHDLPGPRDVTGGGADCGTGRQVAAYLAGREATCPIIVHSANDVCATAMYYDLRDSGWPVSRVYPRDELAWIEAAWAQDVRRWLGRQGDVSSRRGASGG